MGPGNGSHRSLARLEPRTRGVLADVLARDHDELLCLLLVYRDLAARHAQQAHSPLQDRLQHARQLELGREDGHGVEQGLVLVSALPLCSQEPGPAYRDAGLVGRRREDLEILVAERIGLGALDHQHANGLAVHPERHVQLGAGAQAGEVLALSRDVGRVVQLAVQQGLFAEALAAVHAPVRRHVRPADARLEHAIAGLGVEQEDAQEVVPQGLVVQAAHDRAVDTVFVLGGGYLRAKAQQGGLPVGGRALVGSATPARGGGTRHG